MGMEGARNGFSSLVTKYHIFSVYTAVPCKGAAGFFYSTYFCSIPAHFTVIYIVSIMAAGAEFSGIFEHPLPRGARPAVLALELSDAVVFKNGGGLDEN